MEGDLKISVMMDIMTLIPLLLMVVLTNVRLMQDGHALVDQVLSLVHAYNLSLKIQLFNPLEL